MFKSLRLVLPVTLNNEEVVDARVVLRDGLILTLFSIKKLCPPFALGYGTLLHRVLLAYLLDKYLPVSIVR